jgi:hypothetical protein
MSIGADGQWHASSSPLSCLRFPAWKDRSIKSAQFGIAIVRAVCADGDKGRIADFIDIDPSRDAWIENCTDDGRSELQNETAAEIAVLGSSEESWFKMKMTGHLDYNVPRADAASIFSPLVLSILAMAFLYPILVCAVFFPTPYVDLREQINWGLNFPLYTWKLPPLQSWVSALASLVGFRDAWFYMVVAQGLNAVTFYYLIRIARDFVGVEAIGPLVLMGVCNFYLSAWLPTNALNADQVQAPLWSAAICYALRAANEDRWKNWLLLGVMLGLAILAKYSTVVLIVALCAAAAWVNEFRPVFVNPKLYVAGFLGIAIVLPHAVTELGSHQALRYGFAKLLFDSSIRERLNSVLNFVWPVGVLLLPLEIAAVKHWRDRTIRLQWPPATAQTRFIVVAAIMLAAILIAMILGAGLDYRPRYSYAWLPIAALVTFCVVRVEPSGLRALAWVTMGIWTAVYVISLAYGLLVLRPQLREPAPTAAAMMQRDWDRKFACGPGYIIGDALDAHAVALYYGDFWHRIVGLSTADYFFAPWTDKERIRRLGAIVVGASEADAMHYVDRDFPERTSPVMLRLPYRRTWSDKLHSYAYSFIKPHDC